MTLSSYPPKPFRETRRDVLIETMETLRLGLLVTTCDVEELSAVHVPMLVKQAGEKLFLDCHVGVANPIWRQAAGRKALVVFQGPHAYVHPGWYATKKQTGKVVPTWNYISVQARGVVETVRDEARLRAHVDVLSQAMEQGRADPWAITDAPADYMETMLEGIVGLRMEVTDLRGVWKMSQNHPEGNRVGAIDGLASGSHADQDVAVVMRGREADRK
ncbi:MAG: FMN-binding negative transcriptional regulator [Hyphomonadaceae bacterium]|nr:FMN-binding negative transcriptional regulator [Hyphomonadaceae bacterium]